MSRSVLITVVGNLFPNVAALASGPILAHALGVDGRGVVAAATAPLTLVTTIATFGIPEATTYTVARHPGLARMTIGRAAALTTVAGVCAMGAVVGAAGWLSGGSPQVHQLMLIAVLAVVPNLLVGVLRGVASAHHLWGRVALERIFASGLRLLALLPFWLTGHLGPTVATVILAVMPLMGALAYLGLFRRFADPAEDVTGHASYRALFGYGMRIWVGSISGILLSRLDQTLMTPLTGSYQLGLYVIAVTVSELPLIINGSVRDVTFARDASESADDRLAAAARISFFLCSAFAAGIAATMWWWIPRLFGAGFEPSVQVALILLVAVALGTPGSIGGAGLSARGRPGLRSLSLVVACAVNVVLLIVLVPPLGATGAALATLVGNLLSSNLNLVLLQRYFGVPVRLFYGLRRSDVRMLRNLLTSVLRRGR
ncbi:hypothetical protein GCM10011594_03720 [Nakamurella endophytica]|uniref:Polysaccharide biosynthesis protein C-terminal domain-containing protein n=2 Tax=Nakamurella endophytica TaxID=1748367 RepID=A0A917SN18_9ACTN|nr:hypothetical protein GCM10011594_03720 [Nakamurella endophytica]